MSTSGKFPNAKKKQSLENGLIFVVACLLDPRTNVIDQIVVFMPYYAIHFITWKAVLNKFTQNVLESAEKIEGYINSKSKSKGALQV